MSSAPSSIEAQKSQGHQRWRPRHDPQQPADNHLGRTHVDEFNFDMEEEAPSHRGPVSWTSLPRKDQLLVLFIGRLADFLQVASLQAYVFYQLKHMDSSLPDSRISERAGVLQGCFTGAQVCTAMLWGKIADASWCGRKWALVVGLGGTAVSCVGYGFATSFFCAACWRVFGGAVNGTVGIMYVAAPIISYRILTLQL